MGAVNWYEWQIGIYRADQERFKRNEQRAFLMIAALILMCIVLAVKLITSRHETARAEALLYKDFIATMETTNPEALSQETK